MNAPLAERYLSLLKKSLLNELYIENEVRIHNFMMQIMFPKATTLEKLIHEFLTAGTSELGNTLRAMRSEGSWLMTVVNDENGNPVEVKEARNFAFVPHTMIGRARLDNLQECMHAVLADNIAGDFIETGVWKGGSTIFMRGFLKAHDVTDRKVWVADSFAGLPEPSHPEDDGVDLSANTMPYLAISEAEVRELFNRYELLDEQVVFLKGWFRDTLPAAPIDKLAVLRLDGDLYESTMDALDHLYHKLSPGGFVVVDDYNALPQCERAVTDFRARYDIRDHIERIDKVSVYWRKA